MLHQFHPEFEQKLPELRQLLRSHQVVRAYAFGSVLSGKFTDDSDIDLMITFKEGLDPVENGELWWSLWYKIQDLFQRNVDLLIERSIRNPYFKAAILEQRMPVL